MDELRSIDAARRQAPSDVLCPVCKAQPAECVELPLPSVFGLVYRVARAGTTLRFVCRSCGIVFRTDTEDVDDYYGSLDDALQPDSVVSVYAPQEDRLVTNHYLMTKILAPNLSSPAPRVLDIGCGTGDFLREIQSQQPTYRLCGFDVSEHLRARFEATPRIAFFCGDLAHVSGKFDAVTIIDALSFIKNLDELFAFLNARLEDGGIVFVTSPDIARNHVTLLLGTQHYYFTPDGLTGVFAHFGFALARIDVGDSFPRHFFGIARRGTPNRYETSRISEALSNAAQALGRMKRNLQRVAAWWDREQGGGLRLGVLGTKHNAAIACAILGKRVGFVADETEGMVGRTYHGRTVVHPRELTDRDVVVLPYGPSAESIRRRCRDTYRARFLPV